MHSLTDLHAGLRDAILAPRARAFPGAAPASGLDVYRHAYRARLCNALRANYPMLAELLGETEFRRVAGEYARAHPPVHYSIRWHGAELWRDLHGALADLAQMEWALGIAFDAADEAALDVELLRTLSDHECASLSLALHPSVQVLQMSWAVERQWEALRAGESPQDAAPHEHALLVWRMNLQSHWRIMPRDEGAALIAIDEHGSLADACVAAGADKAAEVGAWFARWAVNGLLVPREGMEQ